MSPLGTKRDTAACPVKVEPVMAFYPHLVLRYKQDHGASMYRREPRPRSRQVFHRRRQSDRQWSFHLAAQHAATGRNGKFSRVRIGDDVRAQLVTEKFDLKSLALVVGGSMGAQQTYEWLPSSDRSKPSMAILRFSVLIPVRWSARQALSASCSPLKFEPATKFSGQKPRIGTRECISSS